jgi:hypothetical protein
LNELINEVNGRLHSENARQFSKWSVAVKYYIKQPSAAEGDVKGKESSLYTLHEEEEGSFYIKIGSHSIKSDSNAEALLLKLKATFSVRQTASISGWKFRIADFIIKVGICSVKSLSRCLIVQVFSIFLQVESLNAFSKQLSLDNFIRKIFFDFEILVSDPSLCQVLDALAAKRII